VTTQTNAASANGTAAPFFSPDWADAVRAAVDRGPDDALRATKLDTYWDWIDGVRDGYSDSWALGLREPDGRTAHLLLRWEQGRCVQATISGPDDSPEAAYIFVADRQTWHDLLAGEDTGRIVMYRRLRMLRGDVLSFFRVIYFFVESVAAIGRVPVVLQEMPG
jgi:hypothetical protein